MKSWTWKNRCRCDKHSNRRDAVVILLFAMVGFVLIGGWWDVWVFPAVTG